MISRTTAATRSSSPALYVAPFGLSVGLVTYYRTGTPISRIGLSNAYNRYEFFLATRGSEGRVPADYEADVHLGYPLTIGPVTVTFLADVFSLLNVQRAVVVDQRYNLSEFDDPNYICGTAPGSDDDNRCNRDSNGRFLFGTAIARTLPRQVRFGLRIGF